MVIFYSTLFVLTFFATIIYLAVSKQELRKTVKEFNSPSLQPEDPGRALDPGIEENPDIPWILSMGHSTRQAVAAL